MNKLSDAELFKIVQEVNDVFYDIIYEDEWLKQVFAFVDIDIIKSQQTDFMVGVLGGPKRYGGRNPKDAHPHIFIQEDMWEARESILVEAFRRTNTPMWLQEKWLTIDNAFERAILKNSVNECHGRYKTEPIINIPNPRPGKKVA